MAYVNVSAKISKEAATPPLKLAHNLHITYYDASYILAAAEENAKPLTDNTKLARKIKENTNTITNIIGKKIHVIKSNKVYAYNHSRKNSAPTVSGRGCPIC